MDKHTSFKSQHNDEYWALITSTISSYEVKDISSEGKVVKRLVNDDYFLVNDIWNIDYIGQIPNFEETYKKYNYPRKNYYFLTENDSITLEIKFVFYHKLFQDEWSLATLFNTHNHYYKRLAEFLNERHSRINSLLDLDVNKTEKEWIWWLDNNGFRIKTITKGGYEAGTPITSYFRTIYESLFTLTDKREEWEKDRWDFRVLKADYGIRFNVSKTNYWINFSAIENEVFKKFAKTYVKTRLLRGKNFSTSTARQYADKLTMFLNFITKLEPEWDDLNALTRQHIEKFLEHIHIYANTKLKKKNSNPKAFIWATVCYVYNFIKDCQRYEYSIAPIKPTLKLLYSEDYPNLDKKSDDNIDYIPDFVLDQLFGNLNYLHPEVQPIMWIAFKSGLRISDTLELTQDCLVRLEGKYWIKTDIEKTYVKGHKVPIDDHLANLLAVLIHQSKEYSNDDNNPDKYIFVRYRGSRKGKPYSQRWVAEKINDLITKMNITDEMGNIFHFKNHQFRHTYAVKLLNGGADILTVQELLAHASPEMTMRYARLLEDTKRKEFEKVVKQGVFSFDLNGEIHQISETEDIPEDILDMMWRDEKLNALDNPYGSCRARVNGNCPLAAEPPCLTANDGKPCFDLAVGMSSFDIKKYELLIETTTKWIEASKEYGREDMVKANEKNLERYKNIYEAIKGGNVIFGRFDRMKRQFERKKKKGVNNG
ncbi:tyrosine-type recombinase/integrase [Priestia flexa]|uniref:tyrosine-type recombinase/integrase n=1 Tax=Priestia flexa TaxID=86664 RepID=UPI001CD29814|nr:tyrosine-type recombinase/integrase [Priestia flexa]MCA1202185.1 tyrosine-type recombinase/integrase [Priestia flexa]